MTTEAPVENAVLVATAGSTLPTVKAMIERLNVEATLTEGMDAAGALKFQLEIAERILLGTTEEEIFEAQEAGSTSGLDFAGHAFTLLSDDLEFVQTAIRSENAFPFYCRLRAHVIGTDDDVAVTCGGLSVVTVLYKLREIGSINDETPKALIIKATATANGNTRLSLMPHTVKPARGKK